MDLETIVVSAVGPDSKKVFRRQNFPRSYQRQLIPPGEYFVGLVPSRFVARHSRNGGPRVVAPQLLADVRKYGIRRLMPGIWLIATCD